MYELIHQWSDGYGASLTFTYIPSFATNPPHAFVTLDGDEREDVFADAADLRGIAAAALAMAEAIEAPSAEGS